MASLREDPVSVGPPDRGRVRRWLDGIDASAMRERMTDVNDGVLAMAGLSEGLSASNASAPSIVAVMILSTIAGAVAVASAKLGEGLADREAEQQVVAEERRLLELSPAEEIAELAQHFEAKGVSPETALKVARELSAADAMSAQLEVEYGIRKLISGGDAWWRALGSAGGFVLGASGPVAIAYLFPGQWIEEYTLGVALVWLTATSLVLARLGHTRIMPTVLRSLLIGVVSLGASYLLASLLF